jgi:hypothetical protein
LEGSIHTIKKNTEALIGASKEVGLEVNAEKNLSICCCLITKMQGKIITKIGDRSFENVAQFKYEYLETTNQNLIQEEIKSRLNSGNACYHSVQNLLLPLLPSKNVKIRICKTIILPVVLYGL